MKKIFQAVIVASGRKGRRQACKDARLSMTPHTWPDRQPGDEGAKRRLFQSLIAEAKAQSEVSLAEARRFWLERNGPGPRFGPARTLSMERRIWNRTGSCSASFGLARPSF